MKNRWLKLGLLFSILAMAVAGSLLLLDQSSAKTTAAVNKDSQCEFTVTVEVAFAFLDQGAQNKADDLLKIWKQSMEKMWNGDNGYQTFGECKCKVKFEFNIVKLDAGKDCRDAPAGFHCYNVVDRPTNQRGNVADSHVVPPDGRWNGYGEWTTGASGVDAAHEIGHLMGLADEYEYRDTDGDGVKEHINKNPQKDADGNLKPEQSLMATTAAGAKVLPEQIEKIMKDAGQTCPPICCCGNGAIDSQESVGEQCDPKANPNGCASDQECTNFCQCLGGLVIPKCGDGQVMAPEQCEKNSDCQPNYQCADCRCVKKPEPPPPPAPGAPQAPAVEPVAPTTATGGQAVCGDKKCDETESCLSCPADCGECIAGPGRTWCGDGECRDNENCDNCPIDCGRCSPVCGDGWCADNETCLSCSTDCGACLPVCGNQVCEAGETCSSCANDCGQCLICGDGVCTGNENCENCAVDCGACLPVCGNQVCEAGETCSACPNDCGQCLICGDGVCTGNENCENCAVDCGSCGPVCGDGLCSANEFCDSCPMDCGACAPVCGNQLCEPGENCEMCPIDCGACGAVCGNGLCEFQFGENEFTCPLDCQID